MNKTELIPLICVVGPTASGKTSLSIDIAKEFDGEIISADSMQIYKGMDIATAKPTKEEQQGITHHLLDFLDVDKAFSVAQYCELAHSVITDVYNRKKMPILVGGTGLYVDSVVNNTAFSQSDSDDELRKSLYDMYIQNSAQYLLDLLREFDPDMADKLSVDKNPKRIIRAIEVYKTTGVTMTEHNLRSHSVKSPYKVVKIGLTASDREFLYDRINKRVDVMVDNGLVEEAKNTLCSNLSSTSSMAIGHKELIPFFDGEQDLETCLENLKMQTRRYAKRQLTWFRKSDDINWFNIDLLSYDELKNDVFDVIKKVLINEND